MRLQLQWVDGYRTCLNNPVELIEHESGAPVKRSNAVVGHEGLSSLDFWRLSLLIWRQHQNGGVVL
jgi:hypothetical protein